MFTFMDFSKGYYHIELDEVALFLTIFHTSFGKFRLTIIPFGLTIVGDEIQHKLDAVFSNLDFGKGSADDMFI